MAQINLAETIQKNLGFPPLQKINPNTQEVKEESGQYPENKLSQGAIPSVLAGLYLFATSDQGAATILGGNSSTNWVDAIYDNKSAEAAQKVAEYASTDASTAKSAMERIAGEAVRIAREQLPSDASPRQINDFFTGQRDKILIYLPPALQIGQLLKDNTLDDRTNKMEGPISGLMHKIEKAFSSGKNDEATR
ncbi:MAG: hypothetical protein H7Y03_01620 [Chitinophagaceae bacterium]|nr:hypothetical protein [Chitinophagaceae bacterium]